MLRMAAIPHSIYPTRRTVDSTRNSGEAFRVQPTIRRRSDAFGWQALLAEAYPIIGLMLISAYLLSALWLGDAMPWVGDLSPAE
jgi:hypothetical protein